MSAVPPLPSPDRLPAVHSDDDLLDRWRLLMGPWGFGQHTLWLAWFDADDRQLPALMPLDGVPASPNADLVKPLLPFLASLYHGLDAAWLAMALGRPGPGLISAGDRAWARALDVATLGAHGIRSRPLYLATENRVRPLVLDDL
jgi:hypothetical protein